MERPLHTILLAFITTALPLHTWAQEYDSAYHVNGVSTMRLTITQNSDTTLRELRRYNKDGKRIAYHYSTSPGKYHIEIHDTDIFRSPDFFSSLDRGHRPTYDSVNIITKSGKEDTTIKTYYQRGHVIIRYFITQTREKDRTSISYFEKPFLESIHLEQKVFDEQGRIIEKVTVDSLLRADSRTERVKYHYRYQYTSGLTTVKVNKVTGGESRNCYATYTCTDKSRDSIVMYYEDGSFENYYVMYRDVNNRDSLSITCDSSGTITNRNTYSYSEGYRKIEHSDEKGFIFKTHEYFVNEKGLLIMDVETDHKFGDVRTLRYSYTFF